LSINGHGALAYEPYGGATLYNMQNDPGKLQIATLGGGCFWCLEAAYQQIQGVQQVVSGYAGGRTEDPTYEKVCSGITGHAEVVQVSFDPSVITYPDILDIFWTIHDPTTLNAQGTDVGSQYRSIILYINEEQRDLSEASKAAVQNLWPNPIVTEIVPLVHFYMAEAYHQSYFNSHPEQAYCQIVINPKLQKLKAKFATMLK